jgi:hypothetical protein
MPLRRWRRMACSASSGLPSAIRGSTVRVLVHGEKPVSRRWTGPVLRSSRVRDSVGIWARVVLNSAGSGPAARQVRWVGASKVAAERAALELGGLRNPGAGDGDWATITTRGRLSGTM